MLNKVRGVPVDWETTRIRVDVVAGLAGGGVIRKHLKCRKQVCAIVLPLAVRVIFHCVAFDRLHMLLCQLTELVALSRHRSAL